MTEQEATKIAMLVGDLWPNTPMGRTRASFFAAAIMHIPEFADAARAVNRLFLDERFAPTPGQIIDLVDGTERAALAAWNRVASGDLALSTHEDRAVLRAVGYTHSTLPPSERDRERTRTAFMSAYRDQERDKLTTSTTTRQLEKGPTDAKNA